jgi:hypothetical protein
VARRWLQLLLVAALGVSLAQPASAGRGNRNGTTGTTCQGKKAPPLIGGTPVLSISAGESYLFQPTASDPNCDRLTFSITGLPAWASFSATDGTLSGTAAAGSYPSISIAVTDGRYTTVLPSFSITVAAGNDVPPAGNRPPTITGSPAGSVVSGQPYVFAPTAADDDNDPLTFSILNRPGWASFNTATGRLSGTPTVTTTSEFVDIRITVSDGAASTSLPPFGIVVSVPNRPPVISGTAPATATVGHAYDFRPLASDADGDPLTFTVSGKPSWAGFNAATGQLAGTPAAGAVGTYPNIRINVSDGTVTTALPAFSITVEQVANGSATLSWQPPTQRTDGTPLTNLAGYHILYGDTPGNYPNEITLNNPGLTSYVVDNLPQGTWYFVMTAVDSTGAQSDRSGVGTKTIP